MIRLPYAGWRLNPKPPLPLHTPRLDAFAYPRRVGQETALQDSLFQNFVNLQTDTVMLLGDNFYADNANGNFPRTKDSFYSDQGTFAGEYQESSTTAILFDETYRADVDATRLGVVASRAM